VLASIAILTLNELAHTRACLESLERCTPEPHELVLVDNGSTDGTVELLQAYAAAHPHVRSISNRENRGFAGGVNQALALSRGDSVVLLNNDTVVTPGWLAGLTAALARVPGAGIVGPVSNNVAGPQCVDADYRSGPELEQLAAGRASTNRGASFAVPRVVGFCLLARRAVVTAIGGFDERFGAGNFEDDDWCLRAAAAGFGSIVAEDVFVHHEGGRTFAGQRIDHAAAMRRNAALFEEKWGCTIAAWHEHGLAAVDPGRLPELIRLPLSAAPVTAPVTTVSPEPGPRGALQVEELLARADAAIRSGDAAAIGRSYAEPAAWPDAQRRYEAVRRLSELVLAAGAEVVGPFWLDLYAAAAGGLLGVLEAEPAEPVLLNAAGVLLYELTRAEAASALFARALALDPELPAAAANLAAAEAATAAPLPRRGLDELAVRARRVAAVAAPAKGLTVSLCMIVKDEEDMLPGCLEQIADAVDEIIVVDTGSTDRTVEIAESFGATVIHFPWNGSFADARNIGLNAATSDWLLYLDADEHLAPGDATKLRTLLGHTWREAFLLRLTNLTGEESSTAHPALRLFRNRPGYRFEGRIHEQCTRLMPTYLPERFELTELELVHRGYLPSRVSERDKSRRNLALLELEAREAPSPYVSFNRGSEYVRLGDWERAAASLDDAWAAVCGLPDWPSIGFAPLLACRAARARRELGRLEAARGLLRVALERLPEYTDLLFELAGCAVAAGDRAEAERLLERCLEQGDAPARFPATVGAGSHLAGALLAQVRAA
jgi:GT2 family glycosyltransferase/tetratricopeptide (TPR) repeat protein